MSVTASSATIWEARLEPYLESLSIYRAALCNSNYEGSVSSNAKVKIISVGDVTESAYTGGWDDADWPTLDTSDIEFAITEKRKFFFKVPNIDQQTNMIRLIDEGSKKAAYAVVNRQDQYIASLHTAISSDNCYGTDDSPITIGFGVGEVRPGDALTMLSQELAEALAPQTNPRVVVPIWFGTMLVQEIGARNTNAGDQAIANGMVIRQGMIASGHFGFSQIYASANVPNTAGAKYKVIAGDPYITFASAIEKIKGGEMQNDFADYLKGLYVYGGKILFGTHMALGTFNKGSYKHEV